MAIAGRTLAAHHGHDHAELGAASAWAEAGGGDVRWLERFRAIDIHATAIAGLVLIAAVIAGFLVEMARGHDGQPFTWLGALAGVAYLVAVAVLRFRL